MAASTRLREIVSRHGSLVVFAILFAGFVVRLPFVYADVGAGNDVETFVRWARAAHTSGLTKIYHGTGVDYGPLSVYLLAGAAFVDAHLPHVLRGGDGALITLIKLPSILADVLTAGLLAWTIKATTRSLAVPVLVCALYLFNPAIWYVSAYWGQTDSVYTLFLVATVVALVRGAVVPAWLSFALVVMFKIVAVSVAPLVVAWTLVKHGRRKTATAFAVFLATCVIACLPWLIAGRIGEVVHHAYLDLPTETPRVDVSAYNLWYLLSGGRVHASSHSHVPGLPVTFQTVGIAMFAVFAAVVVFTTLRRGSGVMVAAATLSLGMFMLLTQMHERYLFPVLPLVLLWAAGQAVSARTRRGHTRPSPWWEYGGLSLTFLFNLVTIASFAPSLLTNLVATESDSTRVVVLRGVALAVAALNLALLASLVRRIVLGEGTQVSEQYA